MAKKKQPKVGFLVGIILAAVFVVAAVLFTLPQYNFTGKFLGIELGSVDYNGFTMAFGGEHGYEGNWIFFIPFVLAIIGAAAAVLGALKILKIDARILFGICALLAAVSAIIYIVEFLHIKDMYTSEVLGVTIDLNKDVTWLFAFWGAFALNIVAFLGSVFGIVGAKK